MSNIKTTIVGLFLAILQAWQSGAIDTGDPVLLTLSLLTAVFGWLVKDPEAPAWYKNLLSKWQK